MRNDPAHLRAHAFDQHEIVGCAISDQEMSSGRAKTPRAMAEIAGRHLHDVGDVGQRPARLVAKERAPSPTLVWVQHEHRCSAQRGAGDEHAPDAR